MTNYLKSILTNLLLFCSIVLSAQISQDFTVIQGESLNVSVTCEYFAPTTTQPPMAGNELSFVSQNGDIFNYLYTPAPDFLGEDNFQLTIITSLDPPEDVIYDIHINVVPSDYVSNDDFVKLTSLDTTTIDPFSNDEGTGTSLEIAQVLRGTASVNDDMSITYVPEDTQDDYIVYTATDDAGTISSSTIYITHEEEGSVDPTSENHSMASGSVHLIILNDDSYTSNDSTFTYGTLEQINSYVYKFTSDPEISGVEAISFSSTAWGEHTVDLTIFEKEIDGGNVKDDKFYSAANTMIVFNVKDNDIGGNSVIEDHHEDLLHLGDGEFAYTPPADYFGVKQFWYVAYDGSTEETGYVDVYFNNYSPDTDYNYSVSTPKNQPRVFDYSMPIGTEFFEIEAHPSDGSLEIYSEDQSIDIACVTELSKVFFSYTPDVGFVGDDQFIVRYCASDNNLCIDVTIDIAVEDTSVDECICVDDCVWPGDADNDGKISVIDALTIGRHMGAGGSEREESVYGDIYEGTEATDWIGTQANGKNLKHADANGDGFISMDDFNVIVENYGYVHGITSKDALGIKFIPFYTSSPTITVEPGELYLIDVYLGSEQYPAVDIQGVSFAINQSPTFVDSATVEVLYYEDKYLVSNAPYVHLTHQPTDGIIHTAAVKTNGIGSTGHGIIATASFIVEEAAQGFKEVTRSAISQGNREEVIVFTDIIIEDSTGEKYRLPDYEMRVIVKSPSDEQEASNFRISPNPTSDFVNINSKNGSKIQKIKIVDINGKVVLQNTFEVSSVDLNVMQLEAGMYFISIEDEFGTLTKKLIIQ